MRATVALALATGFCLGCATPVSTDFDPRFDFSQVQRYAWLPDPPGHAGDTRLHNALVDGRVRGAVDRVLRARGYVKVAPENADLLVTYYLSLERRVSMRMVSQSFGYSRRGWHDHHRTETFVREHEQGTLLVDFLDTGRGLLWRGSTSSRVRQNSDPQQRTQQISDAVEAILEHFPPK